MIAATTEYNRESLALMAKLSVRKYKVQCYIMSAVFLILGTVLNVLLVRQLWYELMVLLLCVLYLLRPLAHRKKLLKRYLLRESELSSVPRTQRSEFGEEQIETRTLENGNTLAMKYSALTTIYETVDFLVLMTAGKQCLPLKKQPSKTARHKSCCSCCRIKCQRSSTSVSNKTAPGSTG